MNKYLLTTAILSLGISQNVGATEIERPSENSVIELSFEQVLQDLKVNSQSLKNGDFLAFSRTAKNLGLYSGDGSVLMNTVRTFRY